MTERALPERWSPSAHRAYRTCPRQLWLEYVARVKGVDSPESIRGQVMHAGMEAGWNGAYFGGFQVSQRVEDHIEFQMATYADERFGIAADDPELAEWIETVTTAIRRLGPVHPGDHARIVAEMTEGEVVGEIDGVPLKARIDLVFGCDDVMCIWDWKSSKELPRREDVRRDTQLGVEGFLLRQQYSLTGPIRVAIASIGSGVACEVDLPPDMAEAAARRVARTAREAQQDTEFAPVRGAACADCKVRKHCPLFATGPVPEPGR